MPKRWMRKDGVGGAIPVPCGEGFPSLEDRLAAGWELVPAVDDPEPPKDPEAEALEQYAIGMGHESASGLTPEELAAYVGTDPDGEADAG